MPPIRPEPDALILGIETSCDETAAAVLKGGRDLLSSVVASQIELHGPYGGVVPELASRMHVVSLIPVIERALREAGVGKKDLHAIAVTAGPGLIGALLTGLSLGKALAYGLGLPFYGVNHLEGHLLAAFLEPSPPAFPFVALLVSGGHTALYHVQDFGTYRRMGTTRDDAVGEAYDKVARFLGLGYPGGPAMDRLAAEGDPVAVRLPRPALLGEDLDFSFSGLKTAVIQHVRKRGGPPLPEGELRDLAASFQAACVDVLAAKTAEAARRSDCRAVVVTGGVAANRGLRRKMGKLAADRGWSVHFPSLKFCTDNAAMIALAGHHRLLRGHRGSLGENARADWLP